MCRKCFAFSKHLPYSGSLTHIVASCGSGSRSLFSTSFAPDTADNVPLPLIWILLSSIGECIHFISTKTAGCNTAPRCTGPQVEEPIKEMARPGRLRRVIHCLHTFSPKVAPAVRLAEEYGCTGSAPLLGFQVKELNFVKNAYFTYSDQHKIALLSQLLQRTMVLRLLAGETVPLPSPTLAQATPHKDPRGPRISQTSNCKGQEGSLWSQPPSSLGENVKQDLETWTGQKVFLPKVQFLPSFRSRSLRRGNFIHSFPLLLFTQWLMHKS